MAFWLLFLMLHPSAHATSQELPFVVPPGGHSLAAALFHLWTADYRLDSPHLPAAANPPSALHELPDGRPLPPAPHLKRCQQAEELARRSETRGLAGEDPPWAGRADPDPPWIKGGDRANLPGTLRSQVELWLHQFPPTCDEQRLFVFHWPSNHNGIGSAIHIMGAMLRIALISGRVLVPQPNTFRRADHGACAELGARASLACYFHEITSQSCEARVQALLREGSPGTKFPDVFHNLTTAAAVLQSEQPLVWGESLEGYLFHPWASAAPDTWGAPWKARISSHEIKGKLSELPEDSQRHAWMQAQTTRFLLRWPTAYTCHVTNRFRHQAYGWMVARDMVEILQGANFTSIGPQALENTLWNDAEPFVPRPILSLHIRQGDKGREMQLRLTAAFMAAAYRVRQHVPNLHIAWLTTEMETVLQEVRQYPDWTVLHTAGIKRQGRIGMDSWKLDEENGEEAMCADAFANLIIASECDHFVGNWHSNWSQLIDELRLTNGRIKAGFVVVE